MRAARVGVKPGVAVRAVSLSLLFSVPLALTRLERPGDLSSVTLPKHGKLAQVSEQGCRLQFMQQLAAQCAALSGT